MLCLCEFEICCTSSSEQMTECGTNQVPREHYHDSTWRLKNDYDELADLREDDDDDDDDGANS